jgi:hypothetical protein
MRLISWLYEPIMWGGAAGKGAEDAWCGWAAGRGFVRGMGDGISARVTDGLSAAIVHRV